MFSFLVSSLLAHDKKRELFFIPPLNLGLWFKHARKDLDSVYDDDLDRSQYHLINYLVMCSL